MNFQRNRQREMPEINLIPMIDVLLVILIFVMITTTYSKFSGLEINLPTADAQQNKEQPEEINVTITAAGETMINKIPVVGHDVAAIQQTLQRLAAPGKEPVVIINADAKAMHQAVIDVMQAAQSAGLSHISFATQQAQR
ncbi:biopolymer transporter ExbD [Rugosibacter aromaticivorans]|uniref:Biopolymer transporter ExbD n=1 Tax=Rugosibacter aromaticivorans TaxID=1565605 RepID=A0A0C5J9V3_9PROT|nr:biopolymer transporter ExbD [Rugosibacter aromaticivorans]AJP48479.1 biopolymer transporter ExbD [Rugosibacter aromaticivorans]TBR15352.1 MAG: biopolymer transporter ExbD [Rugosibacter sp.]